MMTKSGQLKLGRVLGLALAVSFLVAASAQADVVMRTADTSDFLGEGYELVKIFTFEFNGTALEHGHAANWTLTHEAGYDELIGLGYDQQSALLRGGGGIRSQLITWMEQGPFVDYVGWWDKDTSVLTVNGDPVGGTGEWFYYLLFNTGAIEDELSLGFGGERIYTFVLYGVQHTPEPATMAILGLGLAGLGLARRRMKK